MSVSAPYLKQNHKDVWYVHWTEDRVGKRVSTRQTNLDAAKAFLATWLRDDIADHDGPKGSHLTLTEVWNFYYEKHVKTKVSSIDGADMAWKQMEPHFGQMLVRDMSQAQIDGVKRVDGIDGYLTRRTNGDLGRKVKPQTVRRELSYILAAIRYAGDTRRGLIDPSFVRSYDLPGPGEPRDRWLRAEEVQALLKAAGEARTGDRLSRSERFIWIALETAARLEAILDLTWDRVDFETGVITFDVPGRKTTKKRRATVPMSRSLRPILERAAAECLPHRDNPKKLVMDHKADIWPALQYVAMKAGLAPKQKVETSQKPKATGISPHVFRHTAATMMARRGVSLFKIAKILGNTIAVVEKTYAKHQPQDLQDGVDLISNGVLAPAE